MSNDDIIRTVENDIEFFTIKETGESGISITGLSLLCGISKSALSQLFSNLLSKTAPKRLKPWIGKDYNLLSKYRKQGGFVKILRADFCADVIIHYAFLGNEIAQESLMKFTQAGINVWIQNITGWQPVNAIPTVEPTIAQIEAVFAGLYALPLKKELIESAKLSAIAKTLPSLASSAEEAKRLLSTQMVLEEKPMSPTQLGLLIGQKKGLKIAPSGRKVNQALTSKGLQTSDYQISKSGKKRLQYQLTELGESYGQMQLDQASNGSKTIIIVRWFTHVVDLIIDQF